MDGDSNFAELIMVAANEDKEEEKGEGALMLSKAPVTMAHAGAMTTTTTKKKKEEEENEDM